MFRIDLPKTNGLHDLGVAFARLVGYFFVLLFFFYYDFHVYLLRLKDKDRKGTET